MKALLSFFASLFMAGCSVFGAETVEIAPYSVIEKVEDKNIEIREYASLVLVSAPMGGKGRNGAFGKLFQYISGANEGETDITMTAPVLMDEKEKQGTEIPMTAPVFMDENASAPTMSFVLPADYTLETAPKPTNPDVTLSELTSYKVATIRFNGRLTDGNISRHRKILENWLAQSDYKAKSAPVTAGYNAPFTLPMMRRNEVLIEIE